MMIRVDRFVNIKELSKIGAWVKEQGFVKYLILCLVVIYFLASYKSLYLAWYDENVMPIISLFVSNILVNLLTIILIVIAIYDIVKKYRMCYRYDIKVILPIFFISILLIICRTSGDYYYVNWIWFVSYVDVIIMFCVTYTFAAIVNMCRKEYRLFYRKDEQSVSDSDSILNDWPIEHKEDDIFDLEDEAIKLAERIKKLDRNKTWSLAVTAPWGTGKTSFLNLILEHISEKDFEVVRFIPRDSKSFKNIQEDFFTSIACVLSKYDSRCSNTLKDYMASLQLIDNRGLAEKVINFYRIWNKASLKDSIKQSFASLNKKVLVLIDDFDRLSRDEILEVLKLIDCNAAFTNIVFLTAYDKEQVNKSLGDSFMTKDACFVDKFFNLDFSIPSRSYYYISRYIEDKLCEFLNANNDEKKTIQQTFTNEISIFEEYIPTLRDAKRFINQFVLDFKLVRGDVFLNEYLLVQMIKYRYPELYKELYRKKFVEKGLFFSDNAVLYLKKDLDKELKILSVLNVLFPNEKSSLGSIYHHIYHIQSFDNYFANRIYSSLRIRDMQALFSLKWNEVTSKIDEWVTNDNQSKEFNDYLNSFDMDHFRNVDFYIRYTEMVAYLACKLPNSRAYWLFMRTIYIRNLEGYDKKYGLNITVYKNRLLEIIKKCDSQLAIITNIHYEYKTLKLNEDEELIKDDDIWPFIKKKFIQTVSENPVNEDNLLNWLYRCVDSMEQISRTLFLDRDCLDAYRKRVEESPNYYIEKFVRLGMPPSSSDWNTIACEPFWKQIFEKEDLFEDFLNQCKEKNIENIERAWNFWQLYKENNYEPIEFHNQGDVQKKIDDNLVEEIDKLKELKRIEKELSLIREKIDSVSEEDKNHYREKILQCKEELDNVTLYISLNGRLRRIIEENLKMLKG